MLLKNAFGLGIFAIENILHLGIHFLRGALAAIALKCAVHSGYKDPVLAMRTADEPDSVAHPKEAHHLSSQCGGVLEVIFRAGGHLAENDFFGGTTAEHAANPAQKLRAG